jgi:hypothetical protein
VSVPAATITQLGLDHRDRRKWITPAPPPKPENLGQTADRTAVLLCNPKNINFGIWRQIRFESMRDISEGTLKVVATLRFDVKFAEESAVAKAINVLL